MENAEDKKLYDLVMEASARGDFLEAVALLRDKPHRYWLSELRGGVAFRAATHERLNEVEEILEALADDRQPLIWLHDFVHPANIPTPERQSIHAFMAEHVESEQFQPKRAISRSAAISYVLYARDPDIGFPDLERHISEFHSVDYTRMLSYPALHKLLAGSFGEAMMGTPAGIVATIQMSRATKIEDMYRDAARRRIKNRLWSRIRVGDLSVDKTALTPDYYAFAYYAMHEFGAPAADALGLSDHFLEYTRSFPKPNRITRTGDPKIALCVPGQLRGYKEAFSTWSCFTELPRTERFVSTWMNIGARSLEPAHADRLLSGRLLEAYREEGRASQSHVNNFIPNLRALFVRESRASRKDLCDLYQTDNIVIEDEPENWSSMRKMYYKHSSITAPIEGFDYIIRIRPDKAIFNCSAAVVSEQITRSIAEREVLVDWLPRMHFSVGFGCGDQIMMGPADLVKQCSNAYGEHIHLAKSKFRATAISDRFNPHSTLAAQLIARNVNVGPAPFASTSLLSAPLPSLEMIRQALADDAAMPGNAVAKSLLSAVEMDIG